MMRLLIFLLLSILAVEGRAHPMPNSLIDLHVLDNRLGFDIKVPYLDVQTVFSVNKELGAITDVSLKHYFAKHLSITAMDNNPWDLKILSVDTFTIKDPILGPYTEIRIKMDAFPPAGGSLRQFVLNYDVILHQIVTHAALLNIRQDWQNGVFSETNSAGNVLTEIRVDPSSNQVLPVVVNLENGSFFNGFLSMLMMGMFHIAEGYDHLLFIVLLILVSPLFQPPGERRWLPLDHWKSGAIRLVKIITAFTIGHSITLCLCTLGWVHLSSRWVEIAIALSILATAVHAWVPIFYRREIWVAGGFGLIHGMAFSNTLTALSLGNKELIWSLFAFNIGIEVVQLGIVLLWMPIIYFLLKTNYYPILRKSIALLGVLASAYWIWERFTELK